MLEDRSYMRKDPMDSRVSVCTILIVTLTGVFLVQYMGGIRMFDFKEYLALSKDGLRLHDRFWQFFTFQFLHSGPWPFHLLFNCLALYFFGREVEQALGPRDFLKLYFGSGLVGGLLEAALMFLPGPAANGHVFGASAGIAGVFTAYALLFPDREVMLLLIPIRFRAVHMLWAFIIFSVVGAFLGHWPVRGGGSPPIANVAHAAHLGGIAAAFAYLRWGIQAESFVARRRTRRSRFRPRELIKVPLGRNSAWQRSKAEVADLTPDEFISREVDPILDKISAHGMQSLTPREKQILESARSKMERR